MPRPSRELTVLHPALAARYEALVAAVAPRIEAQLSPAVAANRVAGTDARSSRLRLTSWRVERSAFAHRLSRLARMDGCLVLADVRDCYRSIRPAVVQRTLGDLGCGRLDGARVRRFLERLAGLGVRGLPVGPDASAVLANAVLAPVDAALEATGLRHLRWVDDVVVAADGPLAAPPVLETIRTALAPLELELNEAKTRVVVDPTVLARSGTLSAPRPGAAVG